MIRHPQRRPWLRQRQQFEQFVADTLNRSVEQMRRLRAHILERLRLNAKAELHALAHRPQRPNRITGNRVRVTTPDGLFLRVRSPTRRVDHQMDVTMQVNCHRVDREIAVAQVSFQAVAAKRSYVNREPPFRGLDQGAPHVALGIEHEKRAVQPIGKLLRQRDTVIRHRDVDVVNRLAQQRIAHRAADDIHGFGVVLQQFLQIVDHIRPGQYLIIHCSMPLGAPRR